MDFTVSADHKIKLRKCEKKDKHLARELEKYATWRWRWWSTWKDPERKSKRAGRLGKKRTSGYTQDYSITKIGQNTKKSPGDLRRLAVIQTPIKRYQQTLVWKTLRKLRQVTPDIILDPSYKLNLYYIHFLFSLYLFQRTPIVISQNYLGGFLTEWFIGKFRHANVHAFKNINI